MIWSELVMSEGVRRAVDCCFGAMDIIDSKPIDEISRNEIRVRIQMVVQLLRGFEKKAWLKTRKGREAVQEIEQAAVNLEQALRSLGSNEPTPVMEKLSILEQRVDALRKTIERLRRMVT